jgi:DNA mismatch repair ATPase MutS
LLARDEVRQVLAKLADVERIASRFSSGLASPRDLVALLDSLA